MATPAIKELLEAGVHFGHQTKRWNPKMKKYIFGERNSIYIVDLEKTAALLKDACDFLRDLAARGGRILFIGTKKQAQETIQEQAKRCGMFYATNRWLGGTLTNFETIKKGIERLSELNQLLEDSEHASRYTKKELAKVEKERAKLEKNLGGLMGLEKRPDGLVVVDSKKEAIAVEEANRLGIPVVALVDTNCDPDQIAYVIPGNDNAIKAIRLITAILADSIVEGRERYLAGTVVTEKVEEKKPKEEEEVPGEAVAAAVADIPADVDEVELPEIPAVSKVAETLVKGKSKKTATPRKTKARE